MNDLVAARRAFNREWIALHSWFTEQQTVEPSALWEQFNAHLGARFGAQDAAVWQCALHPSWRAPLTTLFCEIAHARMQLDPWSDPVADASESRLWSAALAASPRAVRAWQERIREREGELGHGFESVKHRLADNYRRAGHYDERALRLYVEVFTGSGALPVSRRGAGAHHGVGVLLERGAAISTQTLPAEVPARYSLCLLLCNRGWNAAWVGRSLETARAQMPSTRERLQQKLDGVDALCLRISQEPDVASPDVKTAGGADWLDVNMQAEFEEQAQAEAEAQAKVQERAEAEAQIERATARPKRKRVRRRKSAKNAGE